MVLLAACGGGDLVLPPDGTDANELAAVSGDAQSAPASTTLAAPLVVQVTDGSGNPIPGVAIAWTPDAGGAVSDGTTTTGPDGLASVQRTLGPGVGTQHTLATATGLAGSPVVFTHTATVGAATVLEPVSGDGQVGVVGASLAEPLVVRARDTAGNPVVGLAVAWIVGEGGGSLAPATSLTDADGLASTGWTLGTTPGGNSATAVVSGVGTVRFSATGDPGTPPGLTLETQPPAAAVRGVVLSTAPAVQLREPDGSERRAAGVNVIVALVPGGATLRGTLTRATDAEGRAVFEDLALEGPAGAYALAFSASGYTGVISGTITLVRAGTTTEILSDDPDPSSAGAAVRVRFDVRSPGGVPDGSVVVASDDGASCTAAVSVGECTLTLGTVGTRTLTATYAGTAEFEGSAGTAEHQVREAAPPPPTPSATASTIAVKDATIEVDHGTDVTVVVRDANGAKLNDVVVTLTATGDGNSITPASTKTRKEGDAKFSFRSSKPGTKTLTATAGGVELAEHPTITVVP